MALEFELLFLLFFVEIVKLYIVENITHYF